MIHQNLNIGKFSSDFKDKHISIVREHCIYVLSWIHGHVGGSLRQIFLAVTQCQEWKKSGVFHRHGNIQNQLFWNFTVQAHNVIKLLHSNVQITIVLTWFNFAGNGPRILSTWTKRLNVKMRQKENTIMKRH